MTGEIWISVATTDRAESLAALLADIAELAPAAGVPVRLVMVDNSRQTGSRARNGIALEGARARGIRVVEGQSPRGGESIAKSRLRQRELLREALREHGRPRIIWMLDDDVRLGHLVWKGGAIRLVRLHNHFEFLLRLAAGRPDIDMLIGEVTGDPPIPPLATLATRFADLRWNLARFFAKPPRARWRVPVTTPALLREPDAYYDLSVERSRAAWLSPCAWLPRREGATVQDACVEALAESRRLPFGIGFTRPILTDEGRISRLHQGTRRGGNAVFFDPDVCLAHDYPVTSVAGIETRRSDMIGASLLSIRRPGRVVSSGFSVVHVRPTMQEWPSAEEMRRTLLADTLGAQLAREVSARLSCSPVTPDFSSARLRRIREASASLRADLRAVEELVARPPAWLEPAQLSGVHGLLQWAKGLADAAHHRWLDALERDVLSEETHAPIAALAARLAVGGPS